MKSRKSVPRQIPILYYHRIDLEDDVNYQPFCVKPSTFVRQMAWLHQNNYQSISLMDFCHYHLLQKPVPEKCFVLTFDDGYYCNYSQALPILQQYSFTATIFLAVDLIARKTPSAEGKDSFLSWTEIHLMQQAGFSFQSHGCTHRSLIDIKAAQVHSEAYQSKEHLENQLQTEVSFFCYPFSQYDESVKQIIKKAGYLGACGGVPVPPGVPIDWFEIGRTEIFWKDSFSQFRFKFKHGLSYNIFVRRNLGRIKRKLFFLHP